MIQVCKFNPLSDIEETVPDLAVDIAEVMATNTVVSTGDSSPYTKETEISEVGHYLKDKIQTAIAAMEFGRSLAGSGSGDSTQPVNPKQGESA